MPKPTFDFISIGESLSDVFYILDEDNSSVAMDKERNLLCFEYAEKIAVKKVMKVPAAGNASNAAVGASRLGLKSALVSWLGTDEEGDLFKKALKQDKVDGRYLITDKDIPTSEAVILNYKGERTQLLYFQPRTYRMPYLASTRCIYYSAMGETHSYFDKMLLEEIEHQKGAVFVFQPGTTHILKGMKVIKPFLQHTYLFILNLDEAHHLLPDGERTIQNLLCQFHKFGAKHVIITDGKNGAVACDAKNVWHMPIFPGKVVEKTGAGDSFAIGVVAALLKGKNLPEALRWGTANSLSVVGEIGPQKGLLNSTGMKRILRKFARIKPTLTKLKPSLISEA